MEINPAMLSQALLNGGRATSLEVKPQGIQTNFDNNSLLSPEQQRTRAKETAEDFEAMFVQLSLKEMRPKMEGGLFNDGLAQDVFYQFMDEAIAKEISHSTNNFGIADAMLRQGL